MFKPGDLVKVKKRQNVRVRRFGHHETVWIETTAQGTIDENEDGEHGLYAVRFPCLQSPSAKRRGRPAPVAFIWENNLETVSPLDRLVRELESDGKPGYKKTSRQPRKDNTMSR